MLKRAEWSAGVKPKRVVKHPVTAAGGAVDLVVLHHSVTSAGPLQRVLRAIERYHINGEFYDIAYNYLVNEEGSAEGRGALVQGGATGAGIDSKSLSICVLGDYETAGKDGVSTGLVDQIAALLADLVGMGVLASDFELVPHSQYKATACCGKRLKAAIPDVMRLVAGATKAVTGATSGGVKPGGKKLSDAQKLAAIAAILEG